jgi:hypothetical protein
MITSFIQQDTIKPQLVIRVNAGKLIPDSVFRKLDEAPAHIKYIDSIRLRRKASVVLPEFTITDTTSVCSRNSIADITFSDPSGLVRNLKSFPQGQFPFQYAEKTGSVSNDRLATIIQPLKEGEYLPVQPLHHDWITGLIFLSAFLWLVVRTTTRRMFPELTRFLLFRGVNESSSRDIGSLFYWQSTILNFVSFLIIALFVYCAAEYYDFLPGGIKPFLFMLISLGIVIFSITSRHFVCLAAGNLSSQTEAFNEYLLTIYQSYRFSSILIFAILVCLAYTVILPPPVCFVSGAIVLIIFYLYRVIRLLLIFTKRNISILYLILYLCALEILPVLILLKYFTGLI